MAEIDIRDQLTLIELAKRTNDGSLITIVEVLAQTNEWLEDAIWLPSNQTASHLTTQRTSLPTGTWRKLNQGVKPEASSTKQIVEGIGLLEAYSRVDKRLFDLAEDKTAFRSGEDKAFIEGLGQEISNCMFQCVTTVPHGSAAGAPEKFNGLPQRLDNVSINEVYDHGNPTTVTDSTSLYIVQWGENKVHMIYPKNSPNTLPVVHEDLGEETIEGPVSGTYLQAMVSHFLANPGLVVRDERCIVRIASIDSARGTTYSFNSTGSNAGHHQLIEALNALPYQGIGARIYCNNTIKTQMDILAVDKSNVLYNREDWGGRKITTFRSVPVRRVDAILNRETAL